MADPLPRITLVAVTYRDLDDQTESISARIIMCDVCVVNAVKERGPSRRSFFAAGASATAVATVGTGTKTPAMAVDTLSLDFGKSTDFATH